jgi:hypothetical protein
MELRLHRHPQPILVLAEWGVYAGECEHSLKGSDAHPHPTTATRLGLLPVTATATTQRFRPKLLKSPSSRRFRSQRLRVSDSDFRFIDESPNHGVRTASQSPDFSMTCSLGSAERSLEMSRNPDSKCAGLSAARHSKHRRRNRLVVPGLVLRVPERQGRRALAAPCRQPQPQQRLLGIDEGWPAGLALGGDAPGFSKRASGRVEGTPGIACSLHLGSL